MPAMILLSSALPLSQNRGGDAGPLELSRLSRSARISCEVPCSGREDKPMHDYYDLGTYSRPERLAAYPAQSDFSAVPKSASTDRGLARGSSTRASHQRKCSGHDFLALASSVFCTGRARLASGQRPEHRPVRGVITHHAGTRDQHVTRGGRTVDSFVSAKDETKQVSTSCADNHLFPIRNEPTIE
jgi:hypothetical protein